MPFVDHDVIYDEEFYLKSVDPPARASAPAIAKSIVGEFAPTSVIDVGCGTGALLLELQSMGMTVFGLEYSQVGLQICQSRNLRVNRFDLETEEIPRDLGRFDLLISMEVAEHLLERYADPYVDLLCFLSDRIVFSAATPGQGGQDHVNEQPHEYWIRKFDRRGYRHLQTLSSEWSEVWKANEVVSWYYQNIMIFLKN